MSKKFKVMHFRPLKILKPGNKMLKFLITAYAAPYLYSRLGFRPGKTTFAL